MFQAIQGSSKQLSRHARNSNNVAASQRFLSSFDIPLAFAPGASKGARQLKTSFELPDPSVADDMGKKPFQLTKIVATIGPTSEQLPMLEQVVGAGMKIMRLNFSHATVEEVELRTKNLALSQVRFARCRSDRRSS